MSNVEFQNAIPSDFVLDRPVSTSKSILRKNLVQYLPSEQTTFDPSTSSIIRFQVASNSDILLGQESYFSFVFQQTNSNHNNYFTLDVGGVQSLFRTIEIRALGSGILLQRYDQYHKWNAIQSLLLDDPSAVDPQGQPAADSLYAHYTPSGVGGGLVALTSTTHSIVVTAAGAMTGTGSLFTKELKIGDEVVINGTGASTVPITCVGRVTAIASDTAATLTAGGPVDMSAGISAYKRQSMLMTPMRRLVGDGSAHTLTFRPILSLLNHALPLFLLKGGIEISFELELPSRCAYISRDGISDTNAALAMTYQITSPRFYGMMATPHPDIVDEFINQWRSPTGLVYSIPSVRYRRWSSAANVGDDNLHFNPGVRSARKMYMIIQDSGLSEGSSTSMYPAAARKVSMGLRDSVSKFQCQVGSALYPLNVVNLDQDSFELKEQLKNVSGNFGPQRLSAGAWQSNNASGNSSSYLTAAATVAYDAASFVFGADLSRDDGPNGSLTGTDLSVVPLDINLSRSQVHNASSLWQGSPVYHVFIVHDSFLKISSEQMSVMN